MNLYLSYARHERRKIRLTIGEFSEFGFRIFCSWHETSFHVFLYKHRVECFRQSHSLADVNHDQIVLLEVV